MHLDLPGSKSLTQRALLCAALARGESRIEAASDCEDAVLFAEALEALGFSVSRRGRDLRVRGAGGAVPARKASLWLGSSGAGLRFLIPLLASRPGRYVLAGTPRLLERLQGDALAFASSWGARIRLGRCRAEIRGAPFAGGRLSVPAGRTSQLASGLLMAAPTFPRGADLALAGRPVSRDYLRMTASVMRRFGARVRTAPGGRLVVASRVYRAARFRVEPDASADAFWAAAEALTGRRIDRPAIPAASLQGDLRFRAILRRMRSGDGDLRGGRFDLRDAPDLVPPLAAVAAFAGSATEITGISHLAGKESDRIASVAGELRRLGVPVRAGGGSLRIGPGSPRGSVRVADARGDHRIAMMLGVISLRLERPLRIRGKACVAKSFPRFFEEAARLSGG